MTYRNRELVREPVALIRALRKAISKGQQLGEKLCIAIDRESKRAVTCEELRPDVDWAYLRDSTPITQEA